jgi:GTPase SAR1 family protein
MDSDYQFDESNYLALINRILQSYDFDRALQYSIESMINKVLKKRQQKTLALAVVGEFSSGKSTLINTLIRDDLLKTDVLQGTTTAATYIRYGDPIDVAIHMNDNWSSYRADGMGIWTKFKGFFKKPSFSNEKEAIRKFIHNVSADESVSISLQDVVINHPSDVLQSIEIIDTPGANAENPRHGQVAAEVLEDIADVALIAIPADMAGSQSLLKFVKKNLRDVIHRCVFVVTKVDMLTSDRERARLKKQLQSRLTKALGTQELSVVFTAPKLTLDLITTGEIVSNLEPNQAREMAENFFKIEQKLYKFMLSQRQLVISEKISKMIYLAFSELSQTIKLLEENYDQRQQYIQAQMIPDLPSFVSQERSRYYEHLKQQFEYIYIFDDLNQLKNKHLSKLGSLLGNISTKEELSNFTNNRLQGFMRNIQQDISNCFNKVQKKYIGVTEEAASTFKNEFNQIFQRLAKLQKKHIDISQAQNTSRQFHNNHNNQIDDIISQYANLSEDEENTQIGGGAIGAAIGTVLIPIPVVGTIIGGALGAFFGSLFGPSLDELKSDLKAKVKEEIVKMFDSANSEAYQIQERVSSNEFTRIDNLISSYFSAYEALAQQIIQQEKKELDDIKAIKIRIDQDLQHLNHSSERLTGEIQFMRKLTQSIQEM